MSKYSLLWDFLKNISEDKAIITFEEVEKIAGVPIDHSFLKYKKEAEAYGWSAEKISIKNSCVLFKKI